MSAHLWSPDQLMARELGVCWHSPTSDRWPCNAMNAETNAAARLAEKLLAKWKREYEEETAGLPASVDPEFLSPVTDTSHGELALEYAAALLPVVRELGDLRAAEELEAAAYVFDMPGSTKQAAGIVKYLHAKAAALRGEATA